MQSGGGGLGTPVAHRAPRARCNWCGPFRHQRVHHPAAALRHGARSHVRQHSGVLLLQLLSSGLQLERGPEDLQGVSLSSDSQDIGPRRRPGPDRAPRCFAPAQVAASRTHARALTWLCGRRRLQSAGSPTVTAGGLGARSCRPRRITNGRPGPDARAHAYTHIHTRTRVCIHYIHSLGQ